MTARAGTSSFSCKKEIMFITLHQPWTVEETQLHKAPNKNPIAARLFRWNYTQFTTFSSHDSSGRRNHHHRSELKEEGEDWYSQGCKLNCRTTKDNKENEQVWQGELPRNDLHIGANAQLYSRRMSRGHSQYCTGAKMASLLEETGRVPEGEGGQCVRFSLEPF